MGKLINATVTRVGSIFGAACMSGTRIQASVRIVKASNVTNQLSVSNEEPQWVTPWDFVIYDVKSNTYWNIK